MLQIIDRRLGFFAEVRHDHGKYVSFVIMHGPDGRAKAGGRDDVYLDFPAMVSGWFRILKRYASFISYADKSDVWPYLGIHRTPKGMHTYWRDKIAIGSGLPDNLVREASIIDRINDFVTVVASGAVRDVWYVVRPNIGADMASWIADRHVGHPGVRVWKYWTEYDIGQHPDLVSHLVGEYGTYVGYYKDVTESSR
jgi:hypothetical protein